MVQVGSQQLSDDADVPAENNEVFNSQYILSVLDVLLFDAHQDVDLIESEVHLFPASPHYLHCHHFCSFVVVSLDDFSEGSPA